MKTSEEQGLSLFPDAEFTTCPLHAIATALITQTAPSVALIDNLTEITVEAAVTLTPATPLVEVLNNPDEFAALASIAAPKPVAGTPKPIASVPTVYSHVNRLLERVAPPAGVAENLPVDMNMSTGSPNTPATHVAREDCPHLADPEWEALQRLSTIIGEAAVATMLCMPSPTEQHGVALGFIMKEQREVAARATVSTPSTPRVESLKIHVNSYVGREGEPLLRWLVEVDTAITARRIVGPLSKVAFTMSCLGGRARSWAYGRRLTDPTCFSTYEVFKQELRHAYEPPQNEFRSRAEFLDLQQGKHDVHAYAQRARYLISNIVTNPIDEATKVVTFMKGLKDGSVKTYLFREYPSTLEAAITLAMQEEISLHQAKLHANVPRQMPRPAMKPTGGPEPMDRSGATAAGSQQRRGSTNVRCFRCGNNGHYARECTAPVHAANGRRDDTGYRNGQPKNLRQPAGAGPPAGDAVERVDIGHAVSKAAAPSERHSHCKKNDDKPNLIILKVNSKRGSSLRALYG
ncbi:unnamed protein product [Phytophthora fragariaefolia]|uniref:Unnamed protein product n=1 Tax=Phytophthora fragariaefolia TaxID=1490495 RepID=A0A9W6YNU7_9STRA|nr:unnamed protein product [Phytophthora fragariaefolia]